MEMLMNDKRRSGNSGSFADIGDLDKLESELNEIKGDEGSGSSSSGSQNAVWVFKYALTTTRKRSIRNQIQRGTATSDIIGGKSRRGMSDEIPVTSNVSTNYSDREKA
jgi:hypothetical protein